MKYKDIRNYFKLYKGVLYKYGYTINNRKKPDWYIATISINKQGYYISYANNKEYRVHRVLYCLYHKTDIPEGLMIDHINNNPSDNSIENLRLVTPLQNCQNKKHHKDNLIGACKCRNHWRSIVKINYRSVEIGLFTSKEEAHAHYIKAIELLPFYQNNAQFRKLVKDSVKFTFTGPVYPIKRKNPKAF